MIYKNTYKNTYEIGNLMVYKNIYEIGDFND